MVQTLRKSLFILMPLLALLWRVGSGQNGSVSGRIVSTDNGRSVVGATISVLGTSNGTVSDETGHYTLSGVGEADSLLVSYIGYATSRIAVAGQKVIDIRLTPAAAQALDEVVVVGYGTEKKSDLTGSVARADIEDFRNMPNTNIVQSLQGTVPGLNVGQVNQAGQTPGISIRGTSTISGNTDVLIILDGIQYDGSLSALNPADIASIDVLKDASATAVYGAQAANGVILITTREGDSNRPPRVTVNSSYTTQKPTKDFRPMGREEYLQHIRDLFWDEAYLAPDYTQPNPDFDLISKVDRSMIDADGNLLDNNFDWWKAATHPGAIKKVDVGLSGGGQKINYLISLGFTDQNAFIKNDFFQRKNIRVNLDAKPVDWLKIGVKSFGSFVNQDGAEPTLAEIIRQSPLLTPYDSAGNLIPNPFNTLDKNPFLSYDVDDYDRSNYFFANVYSEIDFPFLDGLKYRINFGNNYRVNNHYYASQYGAGLTGEAYKHHETYYDYTLDNILTYDKTFGAHSITATLLYGAVRRKDYYTASSAEGFSRLTLGYNRLQEGAHQYASSNAWEEQLLYQMARVNYKFGSRYLVTGTIRRDGFSGFAAHNKYGIFPSLALGWVISAEPFFQSKAINWLKLRAGYGASGNQTSRYKSLAKLETRPAYVFGDGGSTGFGQQVSSMANADLKWERTVGLNVGLDFALFQSRIDGSIDYYQNNTRDLLFDVALPDITGFEEVSTNLGRLENKGLEITVNSTNINRGDFIWDMTLNFSTNRNEIKELLGKDANKDGKEDDLVASGLFINHSLGTIYDYETDGLYQVDDDIPSGYYPGSYRIVDQNGDGKINSDDRRILGKEEPAYRFSIWNKLTYKNLTLGVLLNAIQGGKNGYLANDMRPLYGRNENLVRYSYFSGMDYWLPSNPDALNPRSELTPAIQPSIYRSRSFVRLQDISLTYNFGTAFLEKTPIKQLSLFVSGKNLVTWTEWKGWDPETNQGLTISGRPVLRSYSFGFNLTL